MWGRSLLDAERLLLAVDIIVRASQPP